MQNKSKRTSQNEMLFSVNENHAILIVADWKEKYCLCSQSCVKRNIAADCSIRGRQSLTKMNNQEDVWL